MNKEAGKEGTEKLIVVRNDIKICPLCHSSVQDRTIAIYKELLVDLFKVYKGCKERNIYTFKMKEIRHMLCKNNYARWGDLIMFGGLVYKYCKGTYGLDMNKCRFFFTGTLKIPVQLTINQITKEVVDKHEVDITHFPHLYELLNGEGFYDPNIKLF